MCQKRADFPGTRGNGVRRRIERGQRAPVHGEDRLEAVLYGDGGTGGAIEPVDPPYLPMLEKVGLAVRMLDIRARLCTV